MMILRKKIGLASDPWPVVVKDEAILKSVIRDLHIFSSTLPNGILSDSGEIEDLTVLSCENVTWVKVEAHPCQAFSSTCPISSEDVKEWALLNADPFIHHNSNIETYIVDTQQVEKEAAESACGQATKRNCIPEGALRMERWFSSFLDQLKELECVDPASSKMPVRIFNFSSESALISQSISPNSGWHIDYLQVSENIVELVTPTDAFQYICTVTEPNGPRTWVLDSTAIDLPVLNQKGSLRAYVVNKYIEALISNGRLTPRFLDSNTWYRVDRRLIHRGPRIEDEEFVSADRAFLHMYGIYDLEKFFRDRFLVNASV